MFQGKYRGHRITVDTVHREKGWVATYQIDGGDIHRCDGHPFPSEEIVVEQAIAEAKWTIDRTAE